MPVVAAYAAQHACWKYAYALRGRPVVFLSAALDAFVTGQLTQHAEQKVSVTLTPVVSAVTVDWSQPRCTFP